MTGSVVGFRVDLVLDFLFFFGFGFSFGDVSGGGGGGVFGGSYGNLIEWWSIGAVVTVTDQSLLVLYPGDWEKTTEMITENGRCVYVLFNLDVPWIYAMDRSCLGGKSVVKVVIESENLKL